MYKGLICIACIKLLVLSAVVWDIGALGRNAMDSVADMAGFTRVVAQGEEAKSLPVMQENMAFAADAAQDPNAADAPKDPKDRPRAGADNAGQGMASSSGAGQSSSSLEKEALLRKQEELNRQEQDLKSLQQDVDAKLVRLQELEAKLGRMLEEAKATKDAKLKHLVDVYSNMKAKQAATVLESLDERIAVKILAGMRGRQAGEILTFVGAEKAARLSEALTKMQVPFE
ncbi:MAG: MotE family protein [Desulfovibrionaceae bacterium]